MWDFIKKQSIKPVYVSEDNLVAEIIPNGFLTINVIPQGYLTENGQVALNRVQLIMSELGVMEDEIFKKRQQTEEMFRARDKAKRRRMRGMNNRARPTHILSGQYTPAVSSSCFLSYFYR